MRITVYAHQLQQMHHINHIINGLTFPVPISKLTGYTKLDDITADFQHQFSHDIIIIDASLSDPLLLLDSLRNLRQSDQKSMIVCLTTDLDLIFSLGTLDISGYVNPIDSKALKQIIRHCYCKYYQSNAIFQVKIITDRSSVIANLFIRNIAFIETTINKNIVIRTLNGQTHVDRIRLNECTPKLITQGFLRTHQSYLINLRHAVALKSKSVLMRLSEGDFLEIPISKANASLVASAYYNFNLGNRFDA